MRLPRALDPIETRVLGALLEKAQTTPDYYPMTVNSLVAACNQKNGRNPVTQYTEAKVRQALERLRGDVLVWRTEGARVDRWNESITRRLGLQPSHRAIIALLLLRGPQTVGELRSRAERMHAFPSLAAVEEALAELEEGTEPLVRELPRQPGQKEARWCDLLREQPVEDAAAASPAPQPALRPIPTTPATAPHGPATPSLEQRVADLESQMEEVLDLLRELRGAAPKGPAGGA